MHSTALAAGALFLVLPLASIGAISPTPAPQAMPAVLATGPITQDPVFPMPSAPISISANTPSLAALLNDLSVQTGVAVRADEQATSRLIATSPGLLAESEVPREAAWSFVEGLLAQESFYIVELRATAPRLIAVVDYSKGRRSGSAQRYRRVEEPDLHRYSDHHAILIETTIRLEHLDVRQLSSALRSLVVNTATMNMLPAGSSDMMVLQGTGGGVADLAEMLITMNRAQGVLWAERAERAESAELAIEAPTSDD